MGSLGGSIISIKTCLDDTTDLAEPVVYSMVIDATHTNPTCVRYNLEDNEWNSISSTVDNGIIFCETNHLSTFSVVDDPENKLPSSSFIISQSIMTFGLALLVAMVL